MIYQAKSQMDMIDILSIINNSQRGSIDAKQIAVSYLYDSVSGAYTVLFTDKKAADALKTEGFIPHPTGAGYSFSFLGTGPTKAESLHAQVEAMGDAMRHATREDDSDIAEIEGLFHECVDEWERQEGINDERRSVEASA